MLRRRHRRPTPAPGLLVGVVVLVALSGCSGEQPAPGPADAQHASDGPDHDGTGALDDLDDPGGLDASTFELPAPPENADWNLRDATYFSMMIVHHRQALDMTDLVEERTDNLAVQTIARAIDDRQGEEIAVMATWLVDHDLPEPSDEDVETLNATAGSPEGVVGMLSPDQMIALAEADGPAFDRLFLAGMIEHHHGAVDLAAQLLDSGEDAGVAEVATDLIATQTAEISRLDDLLRAT